MIRILIYAPITLSTVYMHILIIQQASGHLSKWAGHISVVAIIVHYHVLIVSEYCFSVIDLSLCQIIHIIDLTLWSLSNHTQLTVLSSLLNIWSDNLSDHTLLLPDKHDTLLGKGQVTGCYNCLYMICQQMKATTQQLIVCQKF